MMTLCEQSHSGRLRLREEALCWSREAKKEPKGDKGHTDRCLEQPPGSPELGGFALQGLCPTGFTLPELSSEAGRGGETHSPSIPWHDSCQTPRCNILSLLPSPDKDLESQWSPRMAGRGLWGGPRNSSRGNSQRGVNLEKYKTQPREQKQDAQKWSMEQQPMKHKAVKLSGVAEEPVSKREELRAVLPEAPSRWSYYCTWRLCSLCMRTGESRPLNPRT